MVMLTAAKVGSRSHGIEVLESRTQVAVDFMKAILADGTVPPHFGHLVSFQQENAATKIEEAYVVDGVHPTHIFINNYVFSASNNQSIAKRLHLTDFKMLIWCCDQNTTDNLGLKNLVKMGDMEVKINHKTKYKMYAYMKVTSCTLMDIVSMHEYTA